MKVKGFEGIKEINSKVNQQREEQGLSEIDVE